MKKLYTILLLMLSISSIAQTQNGINWGQYYITGSLTVGQGVTNSWAHSSALFQVGKDTSLKGYRLAWVTDTGAITGTKIFGLQVWQWKDSSEYVWLGTRWRPVVKPTSGGSGSADSLVFSTNYRVDTFRTRVNTVLNTKVNTSDYNSLFDSRLSLKTTDNVAEGTNKYYTDARVRLAISLTTTGTSGSATYNSSTGVLNIPSYAISAETDTTLIATRAWRKKGDDSLGATIATKVGYSDTAAMLSVYQRSASAVKYADTATMLSPYLRDADTANLSARIDTKVKYTDTSSMLSSYLLEKDTVALSNRIDARVKYADTASMLGNYANKPLTSGTTNDSLVVADPSTGVLKRINKSRLGIPSSSVANVRDYGAVGDGVTNDGAAFTAAIATGKDVYVPASSAGYALAATLTLQSGQAIFGDGANSKIVYQNPYATGFYMIKCVGFNNVSNLQFFVGLKPAWIGDNPALWTSGGVEVTGFANTVSNCWFKTISGAAIHVKGQNTNVTDCYVDDNNCGILVSAEYNHVADIIGSNNRRAVYITTGNNTLSGGNFSGGGGLYYNNISNGDHSSVIGCTFNHCNNTCMEFKNTGSGLNVIGCNVWDGEIKITENNGLNLTNCTIGTSAYFTVSGTNTNCVIQNNFVVNTVTLPTDPGIRLHNNFGGTSNKYPRSVDQSSDVGTGTGGVKYAPVSIDGTTYYIKLETSIP